ncbi:hypothetical protein F5148DRAFT_1163101 [Russula earlei]|uniref:Uncharacterized protein n=1 Tax=Russula earlei TaxID=71964 RepID=A0ACC0UL69_9AGAM|nr:hypothetical protein F5148DRAFT_1163101 [Russula earlei]
MDGLGFTIPPASRGDPWFEDGNIILLVEDDDHHVLTAFKVHRGVLARQSEVFETMFDIPQPASVVDSVEHIDGCPMVRMHDLPNELSSLIKALYDGVTFYQRNIEDFYTLAGILRLSSKYFITHLRVQAIRHLTETWSYTITGHDEMVRQALAAPSVDGTTYPYVHPLHVLNLAREVNIRIVIPSVLYFLSIYSLRQLLSCEHPKLQHENPSRPSNQLSLHDVSEYTLMYQYRLKIILDFIRITCGERKTDVNCRALKECRKVFARLASNINQSFTPRTGPFHNMAQAMQWIDDDDTICGPCKRAFRRDVTALRTRLWEELPSVVGLPSWKELLAMDLPSSQGPGDRSGVSGMVHVVST